MTRILRTTSTKTLTSTGTTMYRPTIVDTTNRPHVRTFVGTLQKGSERAKAIARDYVRGEQEKGQQRGGK